MPELTRRYIVMAMATEAPFELSDPEGVFVLKPWKDPAALRALEAYRDNCYPELGREITAWIATIGTGPPVRGGVGKRNEPHVRPHPAPRRPAAVKRGARAASKARREKSRPGKKRAGRKR